MRLIRSFFRLISFLFLVMTIITLVIDAARSVGASTLVMTSIGSTVSPLFGINAVDTFISNSSPLYLTMLVKFAFFCPTWLIFGAFALVFYIVSYDRDTRFEQSAYGEGNV